jgi:membrane protease YdiL (CAAX protease family)
MQPAVFQAIVAGVVGSTDMQVDERSEGLAAEARDQRGALREAMIVFTGVGFVTWLISRFEGLPFLRNHLHLVIGTLFLVTATRCAERQPDGLRRYGLSLGGLFGDDRDDADAPRARNVLVDTLLALWRAVPSFGRELAVALGVCAIVFPPFVLGFYSWHGPARGFAWLPQTDWTSYALTQVLVVGLPEEALFRGYLQGRLAEALPGRMRWLGVPISPAAWLIQAALFALLHFVVDYNPARLAVFFPALMFGWLAALRGGIGAAVLVHAACNLLSDMLVRGWL